MAASRQSPKFRSPRRFAVHPIVAAVLAIGGLPMAFALPKGATPTSGQTTVSVTSPTSMVIDQTTSQAAINWNSFSIGKNESVVVAQPSATSVLLNRVTGEDPSAILGSLKSNGLVFLTNPRGIVFGKDSVVDVGGFLATTLSIGAVDANGRYQLSADGGTPGSLEFDGTLNATGTAALVAPQLTVNGSISASRVGLAAVSQVAVDVEGDGLVFFDASNAGLDTRLQMLGSLRANGAGTVDVMAVARAGFADAVLNMDGVVQAHGLAQKAGRIVIDGGPDGITEVGGTLDAGNANGAGGAVTVEGKDILLASTAAIDASGRTGGGAIRVGGDFHGANAAITDASKVYVAHGATLNADATGKGDGGTVVVWSNDDTYFGGTLSARGGAAGGDGGAAEVSSANALQYLGLADLTAAHGATGSLLLDPLNIDIKSSGANIDGTAGDDLTTPTLIFTQFPTLTSVITNTAVQTQLASASVLLQAKNDITVEAPIAATAAGHSLTLQAGDSIDVKSDINVVGGVSLSASSTGTGVTPTTTGVVTEETGVTITSAGAVSITNNASTVANALSGAIVADSLALAGNVALGGAVSWTLASDATVAGVISGASGLTKDGAGTLTLSNANTYTGGTVVLDGLVSVSGITGLQKGTIGVTLNGGGLQLTTGGLSYTGPLHVGANGGTIEVTTSTDTDTISTAISGSGGLTKTGAGTLVMSDNQLYSGVTTIKGGTLAISTLSGLGSNSALTFDGGTLALTDHTIDITKAVTLLSGGTIDTGILGTVTDTVSGVVGGSGALTKQGAGTLKLTNTDTYTGGTTISAGTLQLSGSAAKLSATGVVSVDSGTTLDVANGATIFGSVTDAGGAITNSSGAASTIAGGLTLTAATTLTTTSGLTIGGGLAGSGNLSKIGTGTLVMGGTSSGYTGDIAVSAGELDVTGTTTAHAVSLASLTTLDIVDGATLTTTTTLTDNGATITNGPSGVAGVTSTGKLAGGLTLAGVLETNAFSSTGNGLQIDATVASTGAGNFTETGSGLVILTAANGYAGHTTIGTGGTGATLRLAADTAASTGAISITAGNTLDIAGADLTNAVTSHRATVSNSSGVSSLGALTLAGDTTLDSAGKPTDPTPGGLSIGAITSTGGPFSLTKTGVGTVTLTAANSYAGSTTVDGGLLSIGALDRLGNGGVTLNGGGLEFNRSFEYDNTHTLAIGTGGGIVSVDPGMTGTISTGITGTGLLTKAGTGTLALSGDNAAGFSGGTTIAEGTLSVTALNQLGTGTLTLDGTTAKLLLLGSIDIPATTGVAIGAHGGTINVGVDGGGNPLTGTIDADITGAGGGTASGALVKDGGGKLVLTGTNTYAGGTTIDAGSLVLGSTGNSATLAGPVTLDSGGTLDISDGSTVTGLVTDNGGELTNSVGAGTITATGGLALAANSHVSSTGTALTIDGPISNTGPVTLTFDGTNLVVSNPNGAFSGDTVISSGKVQVAGANNTLGSGNVTIDVGATLDVANGGTVGVLGSSVINDSGLIESTSGSGVINADVALAVTPATIRANSTTAGDALTINGVVSGGDLVKDSSGTVTLSNSGNSYVGNTTINAGTLAITSDGALGVGSTVTLNGGTLDLAAPNIDVDKTIAVNTVGGAIAVDDTLSGSVSGLVINGNGATGVLTKSGGGVLALNDPNNTYTGGTAVTGGTLQITTSGTFSALNNGSLLLNGGTLEFSAAVAPVTNLFTLGTLGGTVEVDGGLNDTINSAISGAGGLKKTGQGILTLGSINTYVGDTTIGDGTASNNGSLVINDARNLGTGALTLNDGTLALAVAGITLSHAITIGSNGGTIETTSTGSDLVTATIGNALGATGDLTKTGPGTLVLQAANTYHDTTIDQGTLRLDGGAAAAGTGQISISAAATLDLVNAASVPNTIVTSGTISNSTGTGIVTGLVELMGGSNLDSAGQGLTIDGEISDVVHTTPLQLVINPNSTGFVFLRDANTYAGGTTIMHGTLQVDGATATTGSGLVTVDSGATLGIVNGATVASVDSQGGTISNSTGAATISAGLTLDAATTVTVDTSPATGLTINGLVTGGSSAPLTVNGGGTLTLGDAGNNYTGGTFIVGNSVTAPTTVDIAAARALGTGSVRLDAGTLDLTAGGIDLDQGLALSSRGGTIMVGAHQADTVSGHVTDVVSATGALTVTGGGTLTLSDAANSYSGNTTVMLGSTLDIAATGDIGIGGVTLKNGTLDLTGTGANTFNRAITLGTGGGTITNAAGATDTLSGLISGAGEALTMAGSGTVVLTHANTYAGGTVLDSGVVQVSAGNNMGTGTVTMDGGTLALTGTTANITQAVKLDANGGKILVDGSATGTVSGAITDVTGNTTGGLTKLGTGTLTLSGSNGYTHGTAVDAGTVAISNAQALGTGAVTLDTGTLSLTAAGIDVTQAVKLGAGNGTVKQVAGQADTISGAISDVDNTHLGALVVNGGGTLTLSGTNTYHDGTTITGSTVQVAAATNLGSGQVTLDAGTLAITAPDVVLPQDVALAAGGGTVAIDTGLAGPLTDTLSGTITSTSTPGGSLTKTGAGTLILGGTNTFDGLTAQAGTVQVSAAANLGAGPVTLDNGTRLTLAGSGVDVTQAITLVSGSATILVGGADADRVSGIVGGAGALVANGTGTLTLSGANTYGGGTTVSTGTVQISSAANLGSGAVTLDAGTLGLLATAIDVTQGVHLTASNGKITVGAGQSDTVSGAIDGVGTLTVDGGGVLTLAGANSHGGTTVDASTLQISSGANLGAGPLTLDGGTLNITANGVGVTQAIKLSPNGGTVTVAGGNTDTLSGSISDASTTSGGALTSNGAGTLSLTGANTYSGGTTVSTGTVQIVAASNLGTGAVTLDAGTLALAASGIDITQAVNLTTGGGTVTVASGNADTVSGRIADSTVNGALSVDGGGTLSLGGTNTYSGGTTVTGFDNGTTTVPTSVVIQSAANLGTGAVTLDAGTLVLAADGIDVTQAVKLNTGGGTFTVTGGTASTVSGVVGDGNGAGGLTIDSTGAGNGTLTLAGTNTYTGGTLISGATARVSSAANLSTGAVTLDLGTLVLTATGIDLAQPFVLDPRGGTITVGAGLDDALSGTVTGSGNLTKTGTGNLTLTSLNGHTGGTTIDGGTVLVSAAGDLGSGTVTLEGGDLTLVANGVDITQNLVLGAGGGTITVGAGLGGTVSGTIADTTPPTASTPALTKAGSGSLTLLGTDTYGGGTQVAAGTLQVSGATAQAGTGAITLASGTTLDIVNGANVGNAVVNNGATIGNSAGAGTLSGAMALGANATLDSGAAGLTVAGVVSGASNITKTGTGTVTLAAGDTYVDTAVNAGTLQVSGPGSQAGTGVVTLAAGTTLDLVAGVNLANPVVSQGATLSNSTGTGTLSGSLALAGDTVFGSVGDGLIIAGLVNGAGGVTKTGVGSATLTADGNGWTGGTQVAAGTLVAATTGGTQGGALPDAGPVSVASGATLQLASDEAIGSLAGVAGSFLNLQGNTLTTGANGSSTTWAGTTVAGGTLVKTGTGVFTLTDANLYGDTDVAAGTLQVSGAAAQAGVGTIAVETGATLDLVNGVNAANAVTGNGGTIGNSAGGATLTGNVALAADSVLSAGGAGLTISGNLSGTGGITKTGASAVTLTGNGSTYSGATQVTQGTLVAAATDSSAGGAIGDQSAVSVAGGATLQLAGDETIGSLASADAGSTVALQSHTLSTGGNDGSTSFAGTLDGGALVKQGTGTMKLSGTNVLTSTQVAAGILEADSAHALGDGDVAIGAELDINTPTFAPSQAFTGSGTLDALTGTTFTTRTAGSFGSALNVKIDSGASLVLAGSETLGSLAALGGVSVAGGTQAISLTGNTLVAESDANDWGTGALALSADSVQIGAGKTAAGAWNNLNLGKVSLGTAGGTQDSRVQAGVLTLTDDVNILAGNSAFYAWAAPAGAAVTGKITADGLAFYTAGTALNQTGGAITATGHFTAVAGADGSISLMGVNNDFSGGLTALAIPATATSATAVDLGSANWQQAWQGGGTGTAPRTQAAVNVEGSNVLVAGLGIEADTVTVTADQVATATGSKIIARLPFDRLLGSQLQVPGIDFVLRDPGAFASSAQWGTPDDPIAVDIGDAKLGTRASSLLAYDSGLLQVDPAIGKGKTAYLSGIAQAGGGYGFFYVRAQDNGAVLVFYNGFSSPAPAVQSALAAAASEPEKARETLFDEAVRTENVAPLLRRGVIVEVGAGSPATQGTGNAALPPACDPTSSLGCKASDAEKARETLYDEAVRTENVTPLLRGGVIVEVGAGRPATQGPGDAAPPPTCDLSKSLGCKASSSK